MTQEETQEKRKQSYQRYREIADRTGLTDYTIAKMAGFSNVTMTDWKAGRYIPKIDKLKALAMVLGVTLEELLEG